MPILDGTHVTDGVLRIDLPPSPSGRADSAAPTEVPCFVAGPENRLPILALEQLTSFDQACGALPINALLAVARHRGLRIDPRPGPTNPGPGNRRPVRCPHQWRAEGDVSADHGAAVAGRDLHQR